ncbi:MAG: carbohydrate ABC transporter permease [Candidatus Atribacteria bacterium]|nr:carbohydrate ABC transporter permease [Candidatus Atribacteria bacterium]
MQLYPVIWMYLSALKSPADYFSRPFGLPGRWAFENFKLAWEGEARSGSIILKNYMINSLIVCIPSLCILTLVSSIAAYSLAKFEFFGRDFLQSFFIALLAIPVHSVIISVYRLMMSLHLLNTYLALILVNVTFCIPFSVILLVSYFRSFPSEIIEAALIVGCTHLKVFSHIVVPISRGAISSVAIVNFIIIWNEFLFAFVLNPRTKTLTVGVLGYKGAYTTNWTLMLAGLSIATIPSILFYFIFQKNIIKGMTIGAIKG